MHSDEQEIRELVATWMTATKAGDIDTVLSLMAEDVVFLLPGRPPMIGKPAFAAAGLQSDRERPQFDGTSDIQEIKVIGEWAFMWAKLSLVMTPPDGAQSIARAGHTLSVLKKHKANGYWHEMQTCCPPYQHQTPKIETLETCTQLMVPDFVATFLACRNPFALATHGNMERKNFERLFRISKYGSKTSSRPRIVWPFASASEGRTAVPGDRSSGGIHPHRDLPSFWRPAGRGMGIPRF